MSAADEDVAPSADVQDEVDAEDEEEVPASKKAKKTRKDPKTTSFKSGLCFPVARFRKALKDGGYAKRTKVGGAIYLTAVIEYIVAEILELAGNAAKEQKKTRIIPRHIQLAIRNDEELNKYMSNVTIQGGGVIPNIHTVLMPNKAQKGQAAGSFSQEY
eukprot:CAMPEP_0197627280 /NCGR_PEP_ID=MMETSP1338-20131121/5935_1 /TAXON_ID=43686 ORGANISM="Pelagodinium beii, Strain RCC1491" /NCGR_SAMPLE_ID=MMETSP1338 /ASSEMBLY_ACC=CAM_ASM_000754 /LENGTH=158 /DNA_ID=CAMNT_0043197963 /DNA_START=98 /DNA_END=574 /DNA_ORIENTATION=+